MEASGALLLPAYWVPRILGVEEEAGEASEDELHSVCTEAGAVKQRKQRQLAIFVRGHRPSSASQPPAPSDKTSTQR